MKSINERLSLLEKELGYRKNQNFLKLEKLKS